MAAIRDWSFNYNTSTSATTIQVPLPAYEAGDLLLAVLSVDSGSQTWTCAGWSQLFSVTNDTNLAVMYKIAQSGETDPTFTYTTADTANGALLSIQDVNTTTPIPASGGYATANRTGNKQAMPQVTTSVANCLVLYAWTHGITATAIPSVIEGPVTQITAKDGSAHADGFGWTIQPSAGTTPGNVYASCTGTTYNGVLAAVIIQPPASGATKIPTYCASDDSTYIDPIHGTSAFRGNTAYASTGVTTYFGTTLAGLSVTATKASQYTDYGINTYRSVGTIAGPTTKSWTAANLVVADANKPDITNKNVLVHAMPYLPADIQTVYDVGLGLGLAFGISSAAGAYKVWHVHGAGTPWGVKRTPVIVHPDNTSGVIGSGGSFDKTSCKSFGTFTCGNLVSSDWTWTMIWALGTTVVAGGSAAMPIDIGGIVKAVADGHERISALQQAKNQMLLLQPVQIGDGGTNPVYLKLESTAIEFPQIYNKTTKQVYYCSVDNFAGITYYAGPTDTIIHRNSVISSPSRYKWGLHASSSTSATYDFSGLTVIGAGTITLARAITITGLTINDYSTIDASSLTLNNSTITGPPNTNNSITVNSTTAFNSCSIDVTTLSAGNYWVSTATPNKFANCTFTGSTSAGHAIRITATGTYSLVGNTFTGFGADGTTSAAIFNDSGGAVTLNITGGGNTPTVKNGTGASTTVNNTVTLEVNGVKTGTEPTNYVRCRIEAAAGGPLPVGTTIMNQEAQTSYGSEGFYKATMQFNYTADQPVIVKARYKGYLPFESSGTITTSGLTVTAVWQTDSNYNQ